MPPTFQHPFKGLPAIRLTVLSNGSVAVLKASDYVRPEILPRFVPNENVDLFKPDKDGQHVAGLLTGVIVGSRVMFHPLDDTGTYWWEHRYEVKVNGSERVTKIWESTLLSYNPRPLPLSLLIAFGIVSGETEMEVEPE